VDSRGGGVADDHRHGPWEATISNAAAAASDFPAPSRILGISGSLRSGSLNTRLLHAAGVLLPAGVELKLFDGLREVPPYDLDFDVEPADPAVATLRVAIAQSAGVLIATPEFNGSIPGVLKNALDWASRPFPDNCLRGKPVAVIGASSGLFGAVWAQDTTRKVLEIVGADVIKGEFPLGQADSSLVGDQVSLDAEQRASLSELLGVLAARAGAERAGAQVS
jgi:chromate reductase